MKLSLKLLCSVLACSALSGTAVAEIYESKDAEGNPVFSDTPSRGAEVVDLPQGNVADAVTPQPHPAAAEAPKNRAVDQPAQQAEPADYEPVVIIGDDRDDLLEDAAARHQVRDAVEPHEVRDAEERHEVGDFEAPREAGKQAEHQGVRHIKPHHRR